MASVAERQRVLPPLTGGAMVSKLSKYNSGLLTCRSHADNARDIDTRQIWLEIATSYELLIRLEERLLGQGKARDRHSDV